MSGYTTIGQFVAALGSGFNRSTAVRFIHRHPQARGHRKIIGVLRRKATRQVRRGRDRFETMQRGGTARRSRAR